MDLLLFFLVLVLVTLLLWGVIVFQVFRGSRHNLMVAPEMVPVDPMTLSRKWRRIIENESGDLRRLGFLFHSAFQANSFFESTSQALGWIFYHPDLPVVAILWTSETLSLKKRNTLLELFSWSQTHCIFTAPFHNLLYKLPTNWVYHKSRSFRTDSMIGEHLEQINSIGADSPAVAVCPESILNRILESYRAVYEYNLRNHYFPPNAQGEANVKSLSAIQTGIHALRDLPSLEGYFESKPAIQDPSPVPLFLGDPSSSDPIQINAELLEDEIEHHKRIGLTVGKESGLSRFLWAIVGIGVLFIVPFFSGASFELYAAAFLFSVVLLREIGHIIAMWLVGRRVLVLKIIQGIHFLAPRHKSAAIAAWQKALVVFAGPGLGIVLGILFAIWAVHTGISPWPEVFPFLIWGLITVNLIFLLPIYPLDGGEIIHMMEGKFRLPLTVVMSMSVSFFLILAFQCVVLEGGYSTIWSPLALIAFLILGLGSYVLARISQGKHAALCSEIRKNLPHAFDPGDEDLLLSHILPELRSENLGDIERYAKAERLLADLKTEPGGRGILAMVLVLISMPIWFSAGAVFFYSAFLDLKLDKLRSTLVADGYPETYEAFLKEVPEDENAYPLVSEFYRPTSAVLPDSDPFEHLSLVAPILDRFPRGEPLSNTIGDDLSTVLKNPGFERIEDLISRIGARSFIFVPGWNDPDLFSSRSKTGRLRDHEMDYRSLRMFGSDWTLVMRHADVRNFLFSKAIIHPEQAWDCFLEWLEYWKTTDMIPFGTYWFHSLEPSEALRMAAFIDRMAPPPSEPLRGKILKTLEDTLTLSPVEIEVLRKLIIALALSHDSSDTSGHGRHTPLLQRLLPYEKTIQVRVLQNMSNSDPAAIPKIKSMFGEHALNRTSFSFQDTSLRRKTPCAASALTRVDGYYAAMLALHLGWSIHDHILEVGHPPEDLSGIFVKPESPVFSPQVLDRILYETMDCPQGSYQLEFGLPSFSWAEIEEHIKLGPDPRVIDPHVEKIHWAGYGAVFPDHRSDSDE